MNTRSGSQRIALDNGATVAVIGGGPAGSFFAIHLLRGARALGRSLNVTIFERRRPPASLSPASNSCLFGCWKGCNHCAGGISPKLNDLLLELDLPLPPEIIQSRIEAITIQGYWKNIELAVPPGRQMLTVFRGSRPARRTDGHGSLDSFLLEQALQHGANLASGDVTNVTRLASGKPLVHYRADGLDRQLGADLAVFAAGVNETTSPAGESPPILEAFRRLVPAFVPPRCRRALIFEFEAKPRIPATMAGTLHYVEYGSKSLPLEMCSLVPKRGFITAVLVGPRTDRIDLHTASRKMMEEFLALPHIRKLISPGVQLSPACMCAPNLVIRSAKNPFADRVAAVGDLLTARLYKDGIRSAEQTASALAETVLARGIDALSLRQGYGPVLRRFRRDTRFARIVFLLHRLFFASSILSRVLYQAVITERKTTPAPRRRLEQLLWKTASGDDDYGAIFLSMIHPAVIWSILTRGLLITLRNYLTEVFFGLRWEGFGRFTTGVPIERLEAKRQQFAHLLAGADISVPARLEFERMYTIRIHASRERILDQLGRFGEPDRPYLRPRWIRIRRIAGLPHAPGCAIQYEIFTRRLSFTLVLERVIDGHLAVYRVRDGFAQGGVLIFEIETLNPETCALSIYVAFNFTRGQSRAARPFWWLFRKLFPAFVHDVLWNHSLCQLKDMADHP